MARGAELLARRTLHVRARGGIHHGAEGARQLDGGGADPAGAAVDEQRFSRAQLAAPEDVGPDREVGFGQRRRADRIHSRRNRQRLRRGHHGVLGVAASRNQRADQIALRPARRLTVEHRTNAGHGSRELEAGNVRCAGRRRVTSLTLHQVGPVHARRVDPDEDLVRPGLRHGPLDRAQHVRSTELGNLDRNHARLLRRSGG